MEQAESTQVQGVVKSFHQTPKGDVDGLVMEDGSEVRFLPHFGEEVTGAVEPGDEVTCAGRSHVDPKGHQHWHADVVTHVKSGRALNLKGPPPDEGPDPHHRPQSDKPHPDRVPHHEQMLTEIHAIRAALGDEDESTHPRKAHAPHEQVLHALRSLRSFVERRSLVRA
jgi:hypothetical protein